MATELNINQKDSEPMEYLLYFARTNYGIYSFTATTKKEQREIAKYIQDNYSSYKIIDCSKREESIMLNYVTPIKDDKIIIINFQDLFLAPYGETDSDTTITIEDKISWYSGLENPLDRNEGALLQKLNFLRDSFFSNYGKRNCIIGMSPMLWFKLQSRLYCQYWPDLESFFQYPIMFNSDNNFIKSPTKYNDYFNNNEKGENDFSGEKVYSDDMIFLYNGKIVRLPNYSQYLYGASLENSKKDMLIKALYDAPELTLSSKQKKK